MDKYFLMSLIPGRMADANKGTYGKVLIIAGSKGMSGAAYLSGLACYRSGAGLIKLLTHDKNRIILQSSLPEAIVETYEETTAIGACVKKNLAWADFVIAGPGLSQSELAGRLVFCLLQGLLTQPEKKKVSGLLLDADALNLLAENPELMELADRTAEKIPVIVTPHPLEMSRLCGVPVSRILSAPIKTARTFAETHHMITVLKGMHTCIISADARLEYVNRETSPALAKAGSGDVLSGTIGGIFELLHAEKKYTSEEAAFYATAAAVIVHAEAGRMAAETFGIHGVLAGDTANQIGKVLDFYIYGTNKGKSL